MPGSNAAAVLGVAVSALPLEAYFNFDTPIALFETAAAAAACSVGAIHQQSCLQQAAVRPGKARTHTMLHNLHMIMININSISCCSRSGCRIIDCSNAQHAVMICGST
jgi:hypothetical protein